MEIARVAMREQMAAAAPKVGICKYGAIKREEVSRERSAAVSETMRATL